MPTKIEWAAETWNPITGCTPISEGCANCYAKRMATRLRGRCGYPADDPFKPTIHRDRLSDPFKMKKPKIIFVCSMSDLFVDTGPEGSWPFIDEILRVCNDCPQHTFLILTKRIEAAWYYFNSPVYNGDYLRSKLLGENIWLGVTAENQQRANERIPILLQIPAAVRFVSIEPMLGPVDVWPWLMPVCKMCDGSASVPVDGGGTPCPRCINDQGVDPDRLDWVICGGETGPGARPMHPDWARSLRDQCQSAGVPFFFKQWGKYCYPDQMPEDTYDAVDVHHNLAGHGDYNKPWGVGKKLAGRLLDDEEWNQYPDQR